MTIQTRKKTIRLPKHEYMQNGYYFITICVHDHVHCLGHIENGEMKLNPCGMVVDKQIKRWIDTQHP